MVVSRADVTQQELNLELFAIKLLVNACARQTLKDVHAMNAKTTTTTSLKSINRFVNIGMRYLVDALFCLSL